MSSQSKGMGFRRTLRELGERNRQMLAQMGMASAVGDVKPTVMRRANAMSADAAKFAERIRLCEKHIEELKSADQAFLNTCREVLSSALPRVYEVGPGDEVAPEGEAGDILIGRGCSIDDIERVSQELASGLEADVLTPMKQWLFAWSTVQGRLKELDNKRIAMDSRRRQVAVIRRKKDGANKRLHQTTNPTQKVKRQEDLEGAIQLEHHKEDKLATSVAAYESMESEMLEELSGLIRDAVCLKSYLAACTEFQREAFSSVGACLQGQSVDSVPSSQPQEKAGEAKVGAEGDAQAKSGKVKKGGKKATSSHALYGDDIKLPAPTV